MFRLLVTVVVSACSLAFAGLAQTTTTSNNLPAAASPVAAGASRVPVAPIGAGKVNLRTCPKAKAATCRGTILHRKGR